MRLTFRIAAVLVALIISVLVAETHWRLQYQQREFVRDIEREQRLLGNALVPVVEQALARPGWERAERILARVEQAEHDVSIRLVRGERTSANTHEVSRLVEGDPGFVETTIPVQSPEGGLWLIKLAESLADVKRRLDTSRQRMLLAALVSVLVAGTAATFVGDWMVGRPVRDLVEHAREIAEGGLPQPRSARRDELGALADEMRSMVAGLAAARCQAEEEAKARELAERELRRTERLATVGTLGAGLAHELGTPLQVVSGRARGILVDEGVGPNVRRNAEIIREQAQRMERIVRQLLDFSRAPMEVPQTIAIKELLEEAVLLMRPAAEEQGCSIEFSKRIPHVKVQVDIPQIGQVFTNVIKNAIDAMPGGGAVTISAAVVDHVGSARETSSTGRFVRVEIADEGSGIATAHVPHVFDPFFTTKPLGQGTGLGLSVAHGVVREHGGYFDIASATPHGARFIIFLPEAES